MKCRERESNRGVRLRVTEVKWVTAESDTDYPECICSLRISRRTQYSLRWMLSVPFTSSSTWDFSSPSRAGVKKIFWAGAHIYMCHMRETCHFARSQTRKSVKWRREHRQQPFAFLTSSVLEAEGCEVHPLTRELLLSADQTSQWHPNGYQVYTYTHITQSLMLLRPKLLPHVHHHKLVWMVIQRSLPGFSWLEAGRSLKLGRQYNPRKGLRDKKQREREAINPFKEQIWRCCSSLFLTDCSCQSAGAGFDWNEPLMTQRLLLCIICKQMLFMSCEDTICLNE